MALLATATATTSDPGCPYIDWSTISAIQTFNKNTSQYEIIDRECNVLPNTTVFQAIGDIESSPIANVEYRNMPWLINVDRALWPRGMTSLTLDTVGVSSFKATIGGVTQE
ncbi:Aste57867_12563 [Aphanomyces stellatus]|uniref:Aste57867_12563 protein n=1 Tax=Aphanomyces stellatus TaxID=120398 RepID=A0A485KVY6_9STRA|nr:hypothetical protein As57867_012517 [Aphanomyces stellatus]VFT89414.1 Aste57867_12563 [Aphanomyces stellatus]